MRGGGRGGVRGGGSLAVVNVALALGVWMRHILWRCPGLHPLQPVLLHLLSVLRAGAGAGTGALALRQRQIGPKHVSKLVVGLHPPRGESVPPERAGHGSQSPQMLHVGMSG